MVMHRYCLMATFYWLMLLSIIIVADLIAIYSVVDVIIESGKKIHHSIVAITSATTMAIKSATVTWK